MTGILFVCVENRARSQIAEGLARHFIGHQFDIYSAGSKPADKIHPMAVAVMAEIGIDISGQKTKSIDQINFENIETVIALCAEENCPFIPAKVKKISWAMSDPASSGLSNEEQIRKFRKVRDDIRKRVLELRASDQTW